MNRRRLLKALASAPGCFCGSAVAGLLRQSEGIGDTLFALAEVLLGSEALFARSREVLLEHLLWRSEPDNALQPEYRACAILLDELAGGRFSTMSVEARHALMARHRLLPGTAPQPDGDEASRDIRNFVVPDLIAAYYRSPPGWAAVGYTAAFPGNCAGLTEYTRAPS